MILKLPPSKDFAIRKLRANGLDFDGDVDTSDDCVFLKGAMVEDRVLFSPVVVQVRRNALLVEVNPKIGEIVGYQPGGPQILSVGFWGTVDLYTQPLESTEVAELSKLDWTVRLLTVPVSGSFS